MYKLAYTSVDNMRSSKFNISMINSVLATFSFVASTTAATVSYSNSKDIESMSREIKKMNREINYAKHELIQIDNNLEMTCINIEQLSAKANVSRK